MLGTLGKRETDDGKSTTALTPEERPIVERQARAVIAKSVAVAIVATAIIVALPL